MRVDGGEILEASYNPIVETPHVPQTPQLEIWLRDPIGYVVVLAGDVFG